MRETRGTLAGSDVVLIDGRPYVLARGPQGLVFSSGTRALQEVPSDRWELVYDDWSGGLGNGPGQYSAAQNFLTSLPGKLIPAPSVSSLTAGGMSSAIRYWFEEQDAGGRWYLYGVAPQHVVKLDIGVSPPVVRQVYSVSATAGFNSADRIGQPVRCRHSGSTYWAFPVNNGDRIVRMPVPVAQDDGTVTTADTFTAVTSVLKGAGHFDLLPSGRIARTVSSHSAGSFQHRAEVSYLPAASDFFTDANWGEDFPDGSQTTWHLGIMHYDEVTVTRKQDGWHVAQELSDGRLLWRDLLPEDGSRDIAALGAEATNSGAVWRGMLWLLTPSALWRSIISRAVPVGHQMIPGIEADRASGSGPFTAAVSLTNMRTLAIVPAGRNCYASAALPGADKAWHILHGVAEGDDVRWQCLFYSGSGDAPFSLHIQRNGSGAPRLWFASVSGGNSILYYTVLSGTYDPFLLDGTNTFGGNGIVSSQRALWSPPHRFSSPVQVNECELVIDNGSGSFTWAAAVIRDSAGVLTTLSPTLTASGTAFASPGLSCRKLRLFISSTYDATTFTSPPILTAAILRGVYLPDVSAPLLFAVDVPRTAALQRSSPEQVHTALEALRSAGSKTWTDPYGASGYITVQDVDWGAPVSAGQRRRETVLTVRAMLEEYS